MPNSNYKTIKSITKQYPHKDVVIDYRRPYAIPLGAKERKSRSKTDMLNQINELRAQKRAKTTIKDIVLSNDFDMFGTFTFGENRQDIGLCKLKMHKWLAAQRRKYGTFQYLFVPEFHKDRQAIHFHALFKDFNAPLTRSKAHNAQNPGKPVYNFKNCRLGWNTAIPIDKSADPAETRAKIANYVVKYITKDMPKFPGQKRFWVSQGLLRPTKLYNQFDSTARYIVRRSIYFCFCVCMSAPLRPKTRGFYFIYVPYFIIVDNFFSWP